MLKFTIHTDGLEAIKDKLAEGCTEAEHRVAMEVRSDTSPYVPARNLVLDGTTRVDGRFVIYQQPYAHYLYYGKLRVYPETVSSHVPYGATKALTDKDLVFSKAVHGQAQSHWFEASKSENIEKWVRVADKAVKHGFK